MSISTRKFEALPAKRKPAGTSRKAFTLIELLMVIAIVGVLVSLLFPAIQAAREAARRANCQSNLKQIGLAFVQYDELHGHLPAAKPPNAIDGSGNPVYRSLSPFVSILPFIEENELYEQYDFSQNPFDGSNTELSETIISVFICPSVVFPSGDPPPGGATYAVSTGEASPRTPFLGGVRNQTSHNGAIIDPSLGKTAINLISNADGASKTALVGELDYGLKPDPLLDAYGIDGGSTKWAMGYPAVSWACFDGVFNSDRLVIPFAEWETFRSDHIGGVNFVFCDGSIQFYSTLTDIRVLKAIASREGNETDWLTP